MRCFPALALAALVLVPAPLAQDHFDAPWIGYNAGEEATGRYTTRILAEGFTGDDYPNLVMGRAIWNPSFAFLRNLGDGTYATPVHYESDNATWGLDAGDFDLDGDLDMVYTNLRTWIAGTGGYLVLYQNDGAGTLTHAADASGIPFSLGPAAVEVADVNDDGTPDLLGAHFDGRSNEGVMVVLADGTGGRR